MDFGGAMLPIVVDIIFSWGRMLIALAASMLLGLAIGIYAARSKKADKIIIPIVDILQTLPILAFFPFVILIIVASIPSAIGINIGVIFLIITGMLWNIIFGVYESVKALPEELVEVSKIYQMSKLERLKKIYLPASMPKAVEQSILSWSIGLFYLVTSEIFSSGSKNYVVHHGIGVALTAFAAAGNYTSYAIGIVLFIAAVIITRFALFMPMEHYFNRYSQQSAPRSKVAEALRSIDVGYRLTRFNKFVHHLHMPHMHLELHHRKRRQRPRHLHVMMAIEEHPTARRVVYAVIALLVAVLLGALALTHQGLLSYEYVVIVSLFASFARVWIAFAAGLAVAVPIGVYLIFLTKRSGWYLLLFQILSALPATILLPVIAFSLKNTPWHNEIVAFAIFFLSGLWYLVFSVVSNRVYIPPSVMEVKQIFGVTGKSAWKNIYLKAIIPGLITGSVTAIAAEWNASIVAERFTTTAIGNGQVISAVNVGIGKLLDLALNAGSAPLTVMGVTLNSGSTLMIIGLLNLTIMIILINRFVWKRFYRNALSAYK
ncbi:MAG TPA: ABC transporter permease subunit [Candidatus Baltobacteraceae bacterium]|nr:ABC transporter permease subunit [Candidatus Baltobacteraceae bacterium]